MRDSGRSSEDGATAHDIPVWLRPLGVEWLRRYGFVAGKWTLFLGTGAVVVGYGVAALSSPGRFNRDCLIACETTVAGLDVSTVGWMIVALGVVCWYVGYKALTATDDVDGV